MFGTTAGKVIVMSAGGTMIAQVIIHEGLEITYLGWSSERFYLTDRDADTTPVAMDDITSCTNLSSVKSIRADGLLTIKI